MDQLLETQKELEMKSIHLEESNIALKVLLDHQKKDIKNTEKNILENVKMLVFPYLDKMKNASLDDNLLQLLNIIETNLTDIIQPFAAKLVNKAVNLSPAEVRVAKMVKEGKTAKEIADTMHISENTVKEHNSQIRRKLGLKRKKVNLKTYLQAYLEEE